MIVFAAVAGLKLIYLPGFKLSTAEVMLMDLQPDTVVQGELGPGDLDVQSTSGFTTDLDDLNQRYCRGTVQMASAGLVGERRI